MQRKDRNQRMESIFIKITILLFALCGHASEITIDTEFDEANQDGKKGLVLLLRSGGRKSLDADALARAKVLYDAVRKKILRQEDQTQVEQPEANTRNDDAALVEHELEDALAKKSSALEDKPFVQHKGKNDFLVFKAGIHDPFVTVVPNDIYYNVEKRCVNWLDDCNERGIRARLLQRVQSPYR